MSESVYYYLYLAAVFRYIRVPTARTGPWMMLEKKKEKMKFPDGSVRDSFFPFYEAAGLPFEEG